MKSVNVKSFLIGGLLAALVLCLLGSAVPSIYWELHGRFQIAANENKAFILDTATGRVWSANMHELSDPNCAFCLPKLDVEEIQ